MPTLEEFMRDFDRKPRYSFGALDRPSPDRRANVVVQFLELMRHATAVEKWSAKDGTEICTEFDVIREFDLHFEPFDGLTRLFVTGHHENEPVFLNVGICATHVPNGWSVNLNHLSQQLDLNYFRTAIELIRPEQACIMEQVSANIFHFSERGFHIGHFSGRPEYIHWYQYWDSAHCQRLGGIEHVLALPCYRSESFLDGVLIQLTESWFNPNNPDHLDAQRRAMVHFDMDPDWQPSPSNAPKFKMSK